MYPMKYAWALPRILPGSRQNRLVVGLETTLGSKAPNHVVGAVSEKTLKWKRLSNEKLLSLCFVWLARHDWNVRPPGS